MATWEQYRQENRNARKIETEFQQSGKSHLGGTSSLSLVYRHAETRPAWERKWGDPARGSTASLPRPANTTPCLFAFKERSTKENSGRGGHAFPAWRLNCKPANQITDVPPPNCGVQGEEGMGELPRAWRRVLSAGECCSCGGGVLSRGSSSEQSRAEQ